MQLRAVELRRKRMARKVKEPTEKKGRKTTPPFEEWPAWTEAKFFSFLRSGLRAKWSRWPAKYAVLAEANTNVRNVRSTTLRRKLVLITLSLWVLCALMRIFQISVGDYS
jgi:hypothetical protein